MHTYDFIVRNARPFGGEPVHFGVRGGRIAGRGVRLEGRAAAEIDACGRLAVPGFVDPHLHLDKALSRGESGGAANTLAEAIAAAQAFKRSWSESDIEARAMRSVEMALAAGTTVLRTHVDIDPIVGLRGFNALLRVRERLRDTGRLQIVAFPQEGLGDDGYVEGLLDQALRAGADAVGGIPAREADPKAHIDRIFALAKKHGAPIDMHVDESDDPRDLTLEYLAEKTLAEGYAGRVVAGHCTSLAVAAEDDVARIVEKVKRAGITIVTLPSTNLHLGGRRDRGPVGRGLTPVRRLLAAGVNVVCGSDNIRDPFTPFGNARMLENGLLLAHAAHMGTGPELATIFEMATVRAASALGITGYGLDEGARADLVILDAESAADAVVSVAPPLWVIAGGKMLGSQYSSRLRLSRS